MTAARTGSLAAVEALLAKGADPNAREAREQTALMWAAAEGHTPIVETLLAAGADVHASLRSGFHPAVLRGAGRACRRHPGSCSTPAWT